VPDSRRLDNAAADKITHQLPRSPVMTGLAKTSHHCCKAGNLLMSHQAASPQTIIGKKYDFLHTSIRFLNLPPVIAAACQAIA
jgi:hypothetical protein